VKNKILFVSGIVGAVFVLLLAVLFVHGNDKKKRLLDSLGRETGIHIVATKEEYEFPTTIRYRYLRLSGGPIKPAILSIDEVRLHESINPFSSDPVHISLYGIRPSVQEGGLGGAIANGVLNELTVNSLSTDAFISADRHNGSFPDVKIIAPALNAQGSLSYAKDGDKPTNVKIRINFKALGDFRDLIGKTDNTLTVDGPAKNPRVVLNGQILNGASSP
jgi:hypothetical protein